jgi:hypothetical protein
VFKGYRIGNIVKIGYCQNITDDVISPSTKTLRHLSAQRDEFMAGPDAKDEFPWWLRYPTGLGLIWLSIFHIASSPKVPGWLAFALCIFAVCMMYEILVALILGGIAWAFFGAIAGIPTSVALIIGALIIADSNKK